MKQLRHLLLLSLLAVAASSCNRDDDPAPQIDPKVRLLSRSWRTTAITANPGIPETDDNDNPTGRVITDIFSTYDNCERDDIIRFRENLTYVWDEGAAKCAPDDGQVFEAGNWFLSADENTLVLKGGAGTIRGGLFNVENSVIFVPQRIAPNLTNWNIVQLTESNFQANFTIATRNNEGRVTATYTITYTFAPDQ